MYGRQGCCLKFDFTLGVVNLTAAVQIVLPLGWIKTLRKQRLSDGTTFESYVTPDTKAPEAIRQAL